MNRLKIDEVGGVEDSLTASIDYEGMASLEIENPWSGSTEMGFGESAAIRLTKEQALTLAQWLQAWATETTAGA